MIKHMDMALTLTPMEQNIRVTGKKTNNTDRVLRHGRMERCMKEIILKARKTDKDVLHSQMGQSTMELSK